MKTKAAEQESGSAIRMYRFTEVADPDVDPDPGAESAL
jgi:hypothetical protein